MIPQAHMFAWFAWLQWPLAVHNAEAFVYKELFPVVQVQLKAVIDLSFSCLRRFNAALYMLLKNDIYIKVTTIISLF